MFVMTTNTVALTKGSQLRTFRGLADSLALIKYFTSIGKA